MQANEFLPMYMDIMNELLLRKIPINDGAHFLILNSLKFVLMNCLPLNNPNGQLVKKKMQFKQELLLNS